MKKIKLFEEYRIDESYVDDFKDNAKKFFNALKSEGKETQEAFKMLYDHIFKGDKMSDAEKNEVGNQFKDVFKTLGLTAIAIMPGGVIVAIIIKALKLQKHLIPSNFNYLIREDKDI